MASDFPVDQCGGNGGTTAYVVIDGIPVRLEGEPKPYAPTLKFGHGVYAES